MNDFGTPEDRHNAALARTASDWMEIYIEIVERSLRQIEQQHSAGGDAEAYATWRTTNRPRLKRIGKTLTKNGLVLDQRMEVSGLQFRPPNHIIWDNSLKPHATFHWADGQELTFYGDDAGSAVGFFAWWVNFQMVVLGPGGGGQSRIIDPRSPEYAAYMQAKARDQKKGLEPS